MRFRELTEASQDHTGRKCRGAFEHGLILTPEFFVPGQCCFLIKQAVGSQQRPVYFFFFLGFFLYGLRHPKHSSKKPLLGQVLEYSNRWAEWGWLGDQATSSPKKWDRRIGTPSLKTKRCFNLLSVARNLLTMYHTPLSFLRLPKKKMIQMFHENNLIRVQLSDMLMLIKVYIFIYSYHKWFQTSVGFDSHVCFSFISVSSFQPLLLLIVCF